MTLADHYRSQLAWRGFGPAIAALSELRGARVLDLGSGVGDQAALLADLGAEVVGIEGNEEVLAAARARGIPRAEFLRGDLRALPEFEAQFDGVWASFSAAYFVGLAPVLRSWSRALRPGGWMALIEVDDLFAHEPLKVRTRELLDLYAAEALAERRYDFRMGRKLEDHLVAAGLRVTYGCDLPDLEFAARGPVLPEVLRAWRERFALMSLLRVRLGVEYEAVCQDFLEGLAHPEHQSAARVVFRLGRFPD